MTIKFPCPHCKKMLSVKEHLAGKKAACPACKQPITIPTASTVPNAPDVEALAAAAFADEPAQQEAKVPQFVEFKCYYCDEQVKVNAELAGKQAPCPNPECRRIVKVPQLVKNQPKDWRTIDTRTPLVAQQQQQQAPEGAWGSTTSQGRVSRQSLEDAAALPAAAAPAGAKRWVIRGGAAAVTLTAVLGAWFGINAFLITRLETQSVAKVEELAKQLPDVSAAEVLRGIGEYYLLTRKGEQAQTHFGQARAALSKDEQTSRERDYALADLAVSYVDLSGLTGDVDEKIRQKREADARQDVGRCLLQIRSPEVRLESVREVTRRLIALGKGGAAVSLAAQVGSADEVAELTAAVGLELLTAKQTEDAKTAADLVQRQLFGQAASESGEPAPDAAEVGKPKEAGGQKVPLTPAVIALLVALDRRDDKAKFPPPPPTSAGAREAVAAGYAEGLGLRGEGDKARAVVETTSSHGQVQARVGLAASLAGDQPESARAELEKALGMLAKVTGRKERDDLASTLSRLIRVGGRLGMTDALKPAAEAITDRDTKGRAQLEILRARLAAASGTVSESLAQDVDKDSPAHALALAALARHNARVDGPRSVRNSVDGWADEKDRAFGYLGLALGSRDRRR